MIQIPRKVFRKNKIKSFVIENDFILFKNHKNRFGAIKIDDNYFWNVRYILIIEPIYDNLKCLKLGAQIVFIARTETDFYGVIDSNYKVILQFDYSSIMGNYKSRKLLLTKGKFEQFAFDLTTSKIEQLSFHLIEPNNLFGGTRTVKSDKLKTIKQIQEVESDPLESDFLEHVYLKSDLGKYKGKWGIVDASFNVIIPNNYDYIDFFENSTHFKVAIGDCKFDNSGDYFVVSNLKWGVIDTNDKIILPIEFDWVEAIDKKMFLVSNGCELYFNDDFQVNEWQVKGGRWGVYNDDGVCLIPIEFDRNKLNYREVINSIKTIRKIWY